MMGIQNALIRKKNRTNVVPKNGGSPIGSNR
jgi:hypothetical protein